MTPKAMNQEPELANTLTMERHDHLSLGPAIRERLLAMSAATMDRLLAGDREQVQGWRRRRTMGTPRPAASCTL